MPKRVGNPFFGLIQAGELLIFPEFWLISVGQNQHSLLCLSFFSSYLTNCLWVLKLSIRTQSMYTKKVPYPIYSIIGTEPVPHLMRALISLANNLKSLTSICSTGVSCLYLCSHKIVVVNSFWPVFPYNIHINHQGKGPPLQPRAISCKLVGSQLSLFHAALHTEQGSIERV